MGKKNSHPNRVGLEFLFYAFILGLGLRFDVFREFGKNFGEILGNYISCKEEQLRRRNYMRFSLYLCGIGIAWFQRGRKNEEVTSCNLGN